MDEQAVRKELAREMRFQHETVLRLTRQERELDATIKPLQDPTFWDTHRTFEEMEARRRASEDAYRKRSVVSTARFAHMSALESLRAVSAIVRPVTYRMRVYR